MPRVGLAAWNACGGINVLVSICGLKFSLYRRTLKYLSKHLYSFRALCTRRIVLPSVRTFPLLLSNQSLSMTRQVFGLEPYCKHSTAIHHGCLKDLTGLKNLSMENPSLLLSLITVHSACRDETCWDKLRCVTGPCYCSARTLIQPHSFAESYLFQVQLDYGTFSQCNTIEADVGLEERA